MSEKAIDRAVVAYAKSLGILPIKMEAGHFGTVGWPDRLMVLPDGEVFWIEFKAPGKKPTPRQSIAHAKLAALGHRVYVVDNPLHGKDIVQIEHRSSRITRPV